jgi:serine phosphatase RsbU (regulator of sigma subunit)
MAGRRTLSLLIVVVLLGATAVATWLAYSAQRDEARDADAAVLEQVALTARQDVSAFAAGLRGASALVSEQGELDAMRFKGFGRDVLRGSAFSGLALSTPVTPDDRSEFEARTGAIVSRVALQGGFTPLPEGTDRLMLPITLVYPHGNGRGQLIGLDLLSDPTRAGTARAAIREDAARLSPPLSLAEPREPGAVVVAPIRTASGELAGVLSAGVAGSGIAKAVQSSLSLDHEITIMDGARSLAGPAPADDAATAQIGVLGRVWTVSGPRQSETDLTPAVAYGASGLALTLVAAGLFFLTARREQDLVVRRSDAERLAARESLQVRITEAIEREIEGDARLGSLARTMVPAVGDICVVHEVTAVGGVRRVGVAAPDESTAELIRALPEPPGTSPIRAAILSRQPVLYTRISDDREALRERERGIESDRRRPPGISSAEALKADEISSMIVPLVARDRVLGTVSLSVLRSTGRPPLTRDDLGFAMEVATHAAVALDNARLYEQQRDIAVILQAALVPRALPDVPGATVAGLHRAGMAGTEVGGDFYDLFEVAGHWMAVIGDVCGKGPEAAALTALARHTLRATARLGPAGAVGRVHEAIRSSGEHTYCTLCCAQMTPTASGLDVRVTTAGHPEPRVVEPDGTVRRLDVTGPLVGALDDPSYGEQELTLAAGSTLFLCSDGIPEARRDGEIFGDRRLEALLAELAGEDPGAILARVEREVLRFVEGRPRDDLALLALRAD